MDRHHRFSASLAVALLSLTGCRGQSVGTIPEGLQASHHHAPRAGQRSGLQIYVSVAAYNFIIDYATGSLLKKFNNGSGARVSCTDLSGNVYALYSDEDDHGTIERFAHGATTPDNYITEANLSPAACSSSKTGALAVLNTTANYQVEMSVYASGTGAPTTYDVTTDAPSIAVATAYDGSGNLFALYQTNGIFKVAELMSGSSTFGSFTFGKQVKYRAIFWASPDLFVQSKNTIYHLSLANGVASVYAKSTLKNGKPVPALGPNNTVVEPWGSGGNKLGFWAFPKGGKARRLIEPFDPRFADLQGVVISVPPPK